jgi:hypothetical protein
MRVIVLPIEAIVVSFGADVGPLGAVGGGCQMICLGRAPFADLRATFPGRGPADP